MKTRRQFIQAIPATGAAFAVSGSAVLEGCAPPSDTRALQPPLEGHFHPKGKAPSEYTREILEQVKGTLPFADELLMGLVAILLGSLRKSRREDIPPPSADGAP